MIYIHNTSRYLVLGFILAVLSGIMLLGFAEPVSAQRQVVVPSCSHGGGSSQPSYSRRGGSSQPSYSRRGGSSQPSYSRRGGRQVVVPSYSRGGGSFPPSYSRRGGRLVVVPSYSHGGGSYGGYHGGYHGGYSGYHGGYHGGWYGGHRGWYYGGWWYPWAAIIPVLPFYYQTVWIGSYPYYYADGIYYAPTAGGYMIVNPPQDAVSQGSPPDY
jgi:hypothetical protein